jgi:hypothetical protein
VDIVVATSVSKRHENKAWGLDEWSVLNELSALEQTCPCEKKWIGEGMLACLSTKERCVSLDNASGWIASQSSGTMNAKGTKNQPQRTFVASIQNQSWSLGSSEPANVGLCAGRGLVGRAVVCLGEGMFWWLGGGG